MPGKNPLLHSSANASEASAVTSAGALSASREWVQELSQTAKRLRRHIVSMLAEAGSGHPGGSLSAVEVLTALYFRVLRCDPRQPQWLDRDRFILSKGHAAPALYAALAEAGYFPIEELRTLRRFGSRLQGHTDMIATPGVEMSAGSLGQGLSFSLGVALAGRLDGKDYRVYVLLGDGECDEGQVWEAAMAASHLRLDNVTAIVDRNQLQLDGWTRDIMSLEPLAERWEAFGWHCLEVDGHDVGVVVDALEASRQVKGKPTVIIAHTIKGKGVSFMENNVDFHGRPPNAQELAKALEELS